jgi:chemotaxis protein methyltransferase CheR
MSTRTTLDMDRSANSISCTDRDFHVVSKLVYDLIGITLHEGKRELVQARLGKRIRSLGMSSFREYLDFVEKQESQAELVSLLDAISTNLTSFWRESQHFNDLTERVLPRILANTPRGGPCRIRIWSAGCSTGEEPYGLAMIVANELGEKTRCDTKVLATDISTRVLEVARRGLYTAARVAQVPPALRNRYFDASGKGDERMYQIRDEVRRMVAFGRLNLMDHWPMKGPFDIIFCRNVMIYFDKPTQAKLVKRFYDLLNKDGVLYIGHSESLTGLEHPYRYQAATIYERA